MKYQIKLSDDIHIPLSCKSWTVLVISPTVTLSEAFSSNHLVGLGIQQQTVILEFLLVGLTLLVHFVQ